MPTRAETKQETRLKILAAAKAELVENGLLNVSTLEIARRAGVAHGTVFFHFQNKEALLQEVLDRELLQVTNDLYLRLHGPHDLVEMLHIYLDFLEREEGFFVVIAREKPFYPPEFRRIILGREAAVRSYFYEALEQGIAQGIYKQVDPSMALAFLFATLDDYLRLRQAYVSEGSVIRARRQALVETFIKFLSTKE